MAFEDTNSLLIADIGSVHTRLVLIDLAEGQYRLIASSRAHTTAEPPLGKASLGLEHAVMRMTERIGRTLLDDEAEHLFLMPESEGHGVDAFLATSSAGRPMRVFLVGLTPEISLESGQRALAGSYVSIVDMLNPDDLRSEEAKINALLTSEPDLILIVGGTEDGAEDTLMELVRIVERALSLVTRGSTPSVLFAGNQALRGAIKERLSPLTTVFAAQNVRPSLGDEQLFPAQIELSLAYDDYRARSPGGLGSIGRFSQIGVVPTSQGLISIVRYLCQLPGRGLGPLTIDVGSANSVIVGGVRREPHFSIHTDLGMGHNLVSTLETIGVPRVLRWLPFDISADDLQDYAYNKQLRPSTIPATPEDLMVEQAIAREVVREIVTQARRDWNLGQGELLPAFSPIVAAGAILTEAQSPGMSAMLLLDALQPVGVTELRLDPHNLLAALGVAAYLKPLITVQALEAGGLINLGTVFSPRGSVRLGQDAMYVQVRLDGGRVINHTVRGGHIWMAPVLPGARATVMIKLRRGLTINGKRRVKMSVTGGAAGIIFDARGRPLVMPRPRDRAARFMQWQFAMTGQEEPLPSPDQAQAVPLPGSDDLALPEPDDLAGLNHVSTGR